MTSVQAVEAIISIKKRERAQERERQKRDLAVKHDEDLKQAFEDNRAIYEDQQVRKVRIELDHCVAQRLWKTPGLLLLAKQVASLNLRGVFDSCNGWSMP